MSEIVKEDDKRMMYVPLEKASDPPPGLIEHFKDRYWLVHPEKGLCFFKVGKVESALCNANEAITEGLRKMSPFAEVRLVPHAYRRINPNDYC